MIILPEDIKGRFLRYCFKKLGLQERDVCREIFMTREQVKELHKQGMAMGSHSHGHYSMAALEKEFMCRDIKLSKDILSDVVGAPINIFSYAHGHNSATGWGMLADLGFKYAVTIERRAVAVGDTPLLLPRYDTNDLRDFINNMV